MYWDCRSGPCRSVVTGLQVGTMSLPSVRDIVSLLCNPPTRGKWRLSPAIPSPGENCVPLPQSLHPDEVDVLPSLKRTGFTHQVIKMRPYPMIQPHSSTNSVNTLSAFGGAAFGANQAPLLIDKISGTALFTFLSRFGFCAVGNIFFQSPDHPGTPCIDRFVVQAQ